ncbi:MAG: Oligoendopeptidase F, plasmid [Verrucomicrobia bacterium ADurb.Bin474]|nr:MAG: Oligoendopeptidase F, plasmid [Verrucomicrobia bacterium ADurb.Bin474]
MRIPHFYRAFYVYKYATGFSAAVYQAEPGPGDVIAESACVLPISFI